MTGGWHNMPETEERGCHRITEIEKGLPWDATQDMQRGAYPNMEKQQEKLLYNCRLPEIKREQL
jgi:hypothetical protein